MPRLTLTDLFNTLKEWHNEQLAFVEKYSEHIEALKAATRSVESQKQSWPNRHKWLIITVAVVLVVFVAPIVMRKNDICEFSIKFNESVGFKSCEQKTLQKTN